MALLIEQAVNGLQLSMLLFLISSGLALTFGMMQVVNLAHGSLYMLGAFIGLAAHAASGSFALGLAAGALATALCGLVLEQMLFKPLYPRGFHAQALMTFGLIFFFDELVQIIWGADIKSLTVPAALDGTTLIGGATVSLYRLFLIGCGLLLALVLAGVFTGTRLGAVIRACVDDREAAESLGLQVPRVFTLVFVIGAALAGAAGFLAVPLFTAFTGMGNDTLILALVVVVLGGMRSVFGAFVGSLMVGFSLSIGQTLIAGYANAVVYVVLAVVLLVRPAGLIGGETR